MNADPSRDDARARLAARYIALWLGQARAVANPERDHVCEALGEHSPTVLRWHRWSTLSGLVLVGGVVSLTLGVVGFARGDDPVWSLAATTAGAATLCGTCAALWRLHQQAVDVTVGLYLSVLPDHTRKGTAMPEDKPIKDMTMLELLANQHDQEPVEQARRDQPAKTDDEETARSDGRR